MPDAGIVRPDIARDVFRRRLAFLKRPVEDDLRAVNRLWNLDPDKRLAQRVPHVNFVRKWRALSIGKSDFRTIPRPFVVESGELRLGDAHQQRVVGYRSRADVVQRKRYIVVIKVAIGAGLHKGKLPARKHEFKRQLCADKLELVGICIGKPGQDRDVRGTFKIETSDIDSHLAVVGRIGKSPGNHKTVTGRRQNLQRRTRVEGKVSVQLARTAERAGDCRIAYPDAGKVHRCAGLNLKRIGCRLHA